MEPNSNKFSELSPVLELIYVMLSNMAKYLKVYASDIEAEKVTQYIDAKEALDNAIKKFDVLYGLQSEVVDRVEEEESQATTQQATPKVETPKSDEYSFASGTDPESLKKAKEAVQELKTLFSEMKEKEAATGDVAAPTASMPKPVEMPTESVAAPVLPPIPSEEKAPSVASIPSGEVAQAPVVEPTSAPVVMPVTEPAKVEMPSPMTTASEQKAEPVKQDASEIDSILAELRKLQNKGNSEL